MLELLTLGSGGEKKDEGDVVIGFRPGVGPTDILKKTRTFTDATVIQISDGPVGYEKTWTLSGNQAHSPTVGMFTPGTGDFTFEAWVKDTSPSSTSHSILRAGPHIGFYFGTLSNQDNVNIHLEYWGGAIYGVRKITLASWTHLAMVRKNGKVKTFVGGMARYVNWNGQGGMEIDWDFNIPDINNMVYGENDLTTLQICDYAVSNYAKYSNDFTPSQISKG